MHTSLKAARAALFAAACTVITAFAGGDYPTPGPGPSDCPHYPPVTPCKIIVDKELFITDLCVVNDPCRTLWGPCANPADSGAWTFGRLMARMAGFDQIDPTNEQAVSDFVLGLLMQMDLNTFVDYDPPAGIPGVNVTGRAGMNAFISEWAALSGSSYDPSNPADTFLSMKIAPFRLLAIVNRIDLRTVTGGYSTGTGGEARFVFGFLDPDKKTKITEWQELPATIIFEYHMLAKECDDIIAWGKAWHNLGGIPFGDTFNKELQAITDKFTGANIDPSAPNGSGISQVRTNEIAFGDPWELREFRLVGPVSGGITQWKMVTPALSALRDRNFINTFVLDDYVIQNQPDILAQIHNVPHTWTPFGFPEFEFAAGSSLVDFVWDIPSFDFCSDERHLFALNNCNGCHFTSETDTRFTHVDPRPFNAESNVSRFLRGDNNFPVDGPLFLDFLCDDGITIVTREFWDFDRRAQDLCDLLTMGCGPDKKAVIVVPDDFNPADGPGAKNAGGGEDNQPKEIVVDAIFATPNVAKTIH